MVGGGIHLRGLAKADVHVFHDLFLTFVWAIGPILFLSLLCRISSSMKSWFQRYRDG